MHKLKNNIFKTTANITKNSTIKNYFNAAANGDVEVLQSILNRYPRLIDVCNTGVYKKSIYYSARNLKKAATLFLLEYSPRLSHNELNYLIANEWYGSLSSYYFLLDIGRDLHSDIPYDVSLKDFITNKYIRCYFQHRNIDRLIKFYESTQKNADWQKVLDQYLIYSGSSGNSNHIQFVRELKLRTII